MQKEDPPAMPRTVRRRLSALSSLFTHLVDRPAADENPVREIKRPRANRRTGTTHTFSKKQARKVLEAPVATTIQGLRNRAILAVGLQVGARRSEIARLKVSDFHQNQGFWSLHFIRKGGEDLSVSVHPQVAQRIQDYLEAAIENQGIQPGQLTIHADRGASMKSKLVAQLLDDLCVLRSHSRPHVSDDNPFSEAQFKTLKYAPGFPWRFGAIQDARSHLRLFFRWYNSEHRHSGSVS